MERICNIKAVEGGWHKAHQLKGCVIDVFEVKMNSFRQREATQQSLIKRETTHTHCILNENALHRRCVCSCKSA